MTETPITTVGTADQPALPHATSALVTQHGRTTIADSVVATRTHAHAVPITV